mmetsp:Transcript_19150/g.41752  ORF Transcript_19150/g.41752 Transcript_19150/m.41752 type:complete len:235 (+) Transcript_19150:3529-4233(+)
MPTSIRSESSSISTCCRNNTNDPCFFWLLSRYNLDDASWTTRCRDERYGATCVRVCGYESRSSRSSRALEMYPLSIIRCPSEDWDVPTSLFTSFSMASSSSSAALLLPLPRIAMQSNNTVTTDGKNPVFLTAPFLLASNNPNRFRNNPSRFISRRRLRRGTASHSLTPTRSARGPSNTTVAAVLLFDREEDGVDILHRSSMEEYEAMRNLIASVLIAIENELLSLLLCPPISSF